MSSDRDVYVPLTTNSLLITLKKKYVRSILIHSIYVLLPSSLAEGFFLSNCGQHYKCSIRSRFEPKWMKNDSLPFKFPCSVYPGVLTNLKAATCWNTVTDHIPTSFDCKKESFLYYFNLNFWNKQQRFQPSWFSQKPSHFRRMFLASCFQFHILPVWGNSP